MPQSTYLLDIGDFTRHFGGVLIEFVGYDCQNVTDSDAASGFCSNYFCALTLPEGGAHGPCSVADDLLSHRWLVQATVFAPRLTGSTWMWRKLQ